MKRRIISLKPIPFWIIYAAVIVVVVLFDQLTKYYMSVAANNVEGWTKQIFPNCEWLYWHWTLNDGATGGIFGGLKWRNILFFIMTIVGLPIFGYMLYRSRTRSVWGQVAFAFIIGGTLGNAIDRLFLAENGFFTGKVRDFIHVTWFFGIFNVADSFLVVGVVLALLTIVFFDPDSLLSALTEDRSKKQGETGGEQLQQNETIQTVNVCDIADSVIDGEKAAEHGDENDTDTK